MEFIKKHWVGGRWLFLALLIFLLAIPLLINSCGTTTYDTPIAPRTSATLIAPETLKTWVDSGIVNSTGFDKVVVLDVTSLATYTFGHIPGALFVNSGEIAQTRTEGPATDITMVLDGAHIDSLVQKYGIDKNTTIVFTSGPAPLPTSTPSAGNVLNATRAYWIFRYWGFPKEKLKVLDGINFAWNALYGLTPGDPSTPTPSTYSVKNNVQLRTDLRASLGVMINLAEGKVANAIPVDMRSLPTEGSYAGKRGSTTGVFAPPAAGAPASQNDYVAFEGHLKNGKAMLYTDLFDPANNFRFKAPAVLASMFNAINVDSTKIAHVY
jgi:thiosulfate/3-mercaptopyruvate sulfurtransferase